MAIVLQMLVRGQDQDQGEGQGLGQGQGSSSGGDYRLVVDLFELYLQQHHHHQQQQLQQQYNQRTTDTNNPSPGPVASLGPSPGPRLPAKLFSPVLQALAHMKEYDLMLSLLQVRGDEER